MLTGMGGRLGARDALIEHQFSVVICREVMLFDIAETDPASFICDNTHATVTTS